MGVQLEMFPTTYDSLASVIQVVSCGFGCIAWVPGQKEPSCGCITYLNSVPFRRIPTNSSLSLSLSLSSRCGDVVVYVEDINQPSLPTPFFFIQFLCLFLSISVFMALSTVFHSINYPNNSPLSHSVPPVLILPYWYFQLYISS